MRFDYGTTRFVFCIGPWAIKIAKVKVGYSIRHFLHPENPREQQRLLKIYNRFSGVKFLPAGLLANLEEARLYRKHSSLPLTPTYFSFLGLFNIQKRANMLGQDDLSICPFRNIAHLDPDLMKIENFGKINGVVCLLDYGRRSTSILLEETAEKVQLVYNF